MAHLRDLIRFERPPELQLPGWLDRLISAGIVSIDPKVIRRQKVANVVALASAFNAFSRILMNSYYGNEDYLLAQAIAGTLGVAALLVHRLHRLHDNAATLAMLFLYLAGVSTTAFLLGLQSQVQSYFVFAAIAWLMLGIEQARLALGCIGLAMVTALVVVAYAPQEGPVMRPELAGFAAAQSMINAITINAIVLYYALYLLRRAEGALEQQTARAEALVSVVLPNAVAARLHAEPDRRIADSLDGVSILFADLAGFTQAAHREPPERVVAYLDGFVRAFDEMCEAHGVEKIKTIGDAYMAAGGLQGDVRAGAVATGRLALAMQAFQESLPPLGGQRLRLRIGIHTGTAIAGVIGDTRIAYDLWGDAVNVASRMESHGVPGRVHVSEEYRAAAGGGFEFAERGTTEIKGLGLVCTFFLVGVRQAV